MATYHCSFKIIGRSKGRSSVAAAAYRSGEKLYNGRDGLTHDYEKKSGIVYSEIVLPEHAPPEYRDRETLWNAVEQSEKRKNSQTARENEIALPAELSHEEQADMVRRYVQENFVDRGMIADFAIHDKQDGNPHAHIMLTTREVSPEGFTVKNRTWNSKKQLKEWRESWAQAYNLEMEKRDIPDRVDHRSYAEQGIDKVPGVHLGAAHALEQRGIKTERGTINQQAKEQNMEYQNGLQDIQQQIDALKQAQAAELQQEYERKLVVDEKAEREQAAEEERKRRNPDAVRQLEEQRQRDNESRGYTRREEMQAPGADPAQAARNRAGASAEQTAERLNGLKAEYARHELAIQQTQQAAAALRSNYQQLQSRAEGIQEKSQTVEQYSQRIEQLKADRGQLGYFAGKEKKDIDEKINRLEQSKAQVQGSLQRECGAAGQRGALEQIRQQQEAIRGQQASLPDTGKLKEQQASIEQTYRQEQAAAMQRPDKDKIAELTEKQTKTDKPQSMQERMAAAKAESKLQDRGAAESRPPTVSRGDR